MVTCFVALKNWRFQNHRLQKWSLTHCESGLVQEVFPRFSTLCDDTSFAKYLVCDDQGVCLLPIIEVREALAAGALVQVLPQWRGDVREIYVVWPSGKLLNEKAKCLREYLRAYLSTHLPEIS